MYKNVNDTLIEENKKSNNTMKYVYGFTCGTNSHSPINMESDFIRMHSATVQLDTDGNPIAGTEMDAGETRLSIAECIKRKIIDVKKLTEYYVEETEDKEVSKN